MHEILKEGELVNLLAIFLDSHFVFGEERKRIIDKAKGGGLVCIFFAIDSFGWSTSSMGYNFYYFLQIRWVTEIAKLYKILPYCKTEIVRCVNKAFDYNCFNNNDSIFYFEKKRVLKKRFEAFVKEIMDTYK